MPPRSRRAVLTGAGSGLAALLAGCAGDACRTKTPASGDWTQVGHDAQHTGADASLASVTEGADHWRATHESSFDPAGFAVAGDQFVVGGRHKTENGFLRWRSLTDGELLRTVETSAPVVEPPVLTASSVVATCRIDDHRGCYRAYDHDGVQQWTREIDARSPAPPTVSQSTVFGGGPDGTVFALGASDGGVLWERSFGDEQQGGAVAAPVTVDETSVYVPVSSSAEQGIHALSRADGRTQWTIPGPRVHSVMVRTADVLLVSYPAYELAAFDAQSGERRWSRTLGERRVSPPATAGDTVVVADAATLYGLDSATGETRWTRALDPNPFSQPVVAGDTVIVQSESGLVGCSLSDGERRWTVKSGSDVPLVPVDDGFIYTPERDTVAAYTSCQN